MPEWMKALLASGVYFEANNDGGTGAGGEGNEGDGEGEGEGTGGEGGEGGDGKGGKGGKPGKSKLTDAEAQLLKDAMRLKAAKRQAESERTALQAQLDELRASLQGLFGDGEDQDPAKLKEKLAGITASDEERRQRAAGEFDGLKKRLIAEHEKVYGTLKTESEAKIADLEAQLAGRDKHIRSLLVSNAFATSAYRNENLTLTPAMAERLYGPAFRVEEKDGVLIPVAYKGDVPLVDQSGKPLTFDAALQEIVEADPDHKAVLRSKAIGGAGSSPAGGGGASDGGAQPELRGQARIKAALDAQTAAARK